MRTVRGLMLAVVCLALVVCPAALAQESTDPRQLPYHGVLERDGALVNADGVTFRVAIYDASEEGQVVWGPEDVQADVHDGRFSFVIGSDPAAPYTHVEDTPLYLDIQVQMPGDADFTPLQGRQRLLASPMAVAATRSDRDFYVAGALTTGGDIATAGALSTGGDITTRHVHAESVDASAGISADDIHARQDALVDGRVTASGGLGVHTGTSSKSLAVMLNGGAVEQVYINEDSGTHNEGLVIVGAGASLDPVRVPLHVDASRYVDGGHYGGGHSPGQFSAYFRGSAISAGWHTHSDARLKNVLGDHDTARCLDNLLRFRLKEYSFREEYAPHIGKDPAIREVGLLAQEVEDILPQAVSTGFPLRDKERVLIPDPRTIQPDRLVYESIGAIQALHREMKHDIQELRRENRALRAEIDTLRRAIGNE